MVAQDRNDVQQAQNGISRKRPHIEVKFDSEDHEVPDSTSLKPSQGDSEKPEETKENKEKDCEKNPSSKSRILASKIWTGLASHFQWVPPNNTWSKWKPVIRCALAAWISAIIFIVPKSETAMGQVSERLSRLNSQTNFNYLRRLFHRPASWFS